MNHINFIKVFLLHCKCFFISGLFASKRNTLSGNKRFIIKEVINEAGWDSAWPGPIQQFSGTLLTAVWFGYPEYYPVLFGLTQTVGISIPIVYERTEASEGKGTPIVRPRYLFKKREGM